LLQELAFCKQRHKVDQEHQLWQEGSHPIQIDTEAMMWQKIEYIHNNPVRRGFVDDPTAWRYSSARCYAGQTGLLETVVDWRLTTLGESRWVAGFDGTEAEPPMQLVPRQSL
jgi:hypothetical protein